MLIIELPNPIEFEWDRGNSEKNYLKHGVSNLGAEEAFVNFNIVQPDEKHSKAEPRFNLLGLNDEQKILYITFTVRNNKVRIISARYADKYERRIYEEAKKTA